MDRNLLLHHDHRNIIDNRKKNRTKKRDDIRVHKRDCKRVGNRRDRRNDRRIHHSSCQFAVLRSRKDSSGDMAHGSGDASAPRDRKQRDREWLVERDKPEFDGRTNTHYSRRMVRKGFIGQATTGGLRGGELPVRDFLISRKG